MQAQEWRRLVCKKFSGVPQFQMGVCDMVEEARYRVDWQGSLEVVAGRVWKFLEAKHRHDILAELAGVPAVDVVDLDAAKIQVLEAVATHRGELDNLGPRLSIYVEVPVTGWSASVRVEVLAWLGEFATEVYIAGGTTLRFRPSAPVGKGGPMLG